MAISDLSKEQINQYANESTNWKDFMTKCGYTNYGSRYYLKKKLDLYNISISHFIKSNTSKKYTDEELFIENSTYTTTVGIKNRLVKYHNWKLECSNCKLSEWLGQQIPIEVDHINGVHTDNRIENLRFLCPNCHAFTDTYRGKNVKNKEHSQDKINKLKQSKICKNCNNIKHKNSEYCLKCHTSIKLHNSQEKINKKCIDCEAYILTASERCIECYKKAKKLGTFEKEHINTTNMKKCPDCDKFISKKSLRCRLCHYTLMKTKSNTNSKEQIKGHCLDCNTQIDKKAIRCVICSATVIENANKKYQISV